MEAFPGASVVVGLPGHFGLPGGLPARVEPPGGPGGVGGGGDPPAQRPHQPEEPLLEEVVDVEEGDTEPQPHVAPDPAQDAHRLKLRTSLGESRAKKNRSKK